MQPPLPSGPALPNFIERGIGAVKRWFTEGNVPVKIGMLVLLAGVAALLKYVSDQGWLVLPIELRLAGVTVVHWACWRSAGTSASAGACLRWPCRVVPSACCC